MPTRTASSRRWAGHSTKTGRGGGNMESMRRILMRGGLAIGGMCLAGGLVIGQAQAASLEVFHADSLAGPMQEIKKAFEAKYQGVTINLTSGVSRQLAERIVKGDPCDVFAPSSPAVIDEDLMRKPIAGSPRDR